MELMTQSISLLLLATYLRCIVNGSSQLDWYVSMPIMWCATLDTAVPSGPPAYPPSIGPKHMPIAPPMDRATVTLFSLLKSTFIGSMQQIMYPSDCLIPNFGCNAAASAMSDSAVASEFIIGIPCLPTLLHASLARTAFLCAASTSRGDAGLTRMPPTRVIAGVVMALVSGISAYPSTSVRNDLSLEQAPPPAPRR